MNTARQKIVNRETFAQLYEEYMPKVFRYIQYKVNRIELAEDLTSVAFEKALTNLDKFSAEKASFSTWLFSIARNTVIDHFRSEAKRHSIPLDDAPDVPSKDPLPEDMAVKKEEIHMLQRCLSILSPEEKEIISLKFGMGLNNREIAKMCKLSESNVGTKLYRTIRKLRDSFQELEHA